MEIQLMYDQWTYIEYSSEHPEQPGKHHEGQPL